MNGAHYNKPKYLRTQYHNELTTYFGNISDKSQIITLNSVKLR